jgi:CheY-like chemotaxis protein
MQSLRKHVKIRKRRVAQLMVSKEEARRYGLHAPAEAGTGERWLSPNQAGRVTGVTGEAVKQWIYRRRLPATKLPNGYWQINARDLEAFIHAARHPARRRLVILAREPEAARMLEKAIGGLGHEAVVCHNLHDALLKTASLSPALFAVDVTLPDDAGWEFLRKVRSLRHVRHAPILVFSERDLPESDIETGLRLGVQGFLKGAPDVKAVEAEIARLLHQVTT